MKELREAVAKWLYYNFYKGNYIICDGIDWEYTHLYCKDIKNLCYDRADAILALVGVDKMLEIIKLAKEFHGAYRNELEEAGKHKNISKKSFLKTIKKANEFIEAYWKADILTLKK